MRLHDFELSADCYKLRLMLSILGLGYEVVPVDVFPGREHEGAAFRALNPDGRVPVLVIGGTLWTDPEATLAQLARIHDETWLDAGDIESWLATSRRLGASSGLARLSVNFGYDHDLPALQLQAHAELRRIDEHLWFGERQQCDWVCAAGRPTIADIACFPDIVLCEEGGISRQDYPAVRRWLDRVKRIPGFTTMSGVFPAAPL